MLKKATLVEQEIESVHAHERVGAGPNDRGNGVGGGSNDNDNDSSSSADTAQPIGVPIALANGDVAFRLHVPLNADEEYVGQNIRLLVSVSRTAPFSVRDQPDVFAPSVDYESLLFAKHV